MMLFEGMPWPLVIPIAIIVMIYAIITSRKEEKEFQKEIDQINSAQSSIEDAAKRNNQTHNDEQQA